MNGGRPDSLTDLHTDHTLLEQIRAGEQVDGDGLDAMLAAWRNTVTT